MTATKLTMTATTMMATNHDGHKHACGRHGHGLWPSWSWCVAVMVCGRHGIGSGLVVGLGLVTLLPSSFIGTKSVGIVWCTPVTRINMTPVYQYRPQSVSLRRPEHQGHCSWWHCADLYEFCVTITQTKLYRVRQKIAQLWSATTFLITSVGISSSSSSRASPGLERSRFHELPPSFSVLGKSPCWVESVVERMEVCIYGI